MKGVIVQIGEPKSIVLFNNGKIGAIPTPANCHVGMVVSVKLNSTLKIIVITLAAILLVGVGVFIGAAFRNEKIILPPPVTRSIMPEQGRAAQNTDKYGRQPQSTSAAEAGNLPDDTEVVLSGNIIQSLGDEKYTFRDSSGDITVEIKKKLWRGLSVDNSDTVEIAGEIDIERGRVIIDVKSIRKR